MSRVKNILLFLVLIVLGRLWIEVDQFFLPHQMLFPAFTALICLLLIWYFLVVKPINVRRLSLLLSGSVAIVVAVLSVLQHIILQHDFTVMWQHSLLLLVISFCLPLVVGGGYAVLVKCKNG